MSAVIKSISISTRKNRWVMMVSILFFTVLMGVNIMNFVMLHIFQPLGFAFDALFIFVLFNRINAEYICEIEAKSLVFIKKSFWGTKKYEVLNHSIMGIYLYQPKLIDITNFRRTYRMQSALDPRNVWTVAYTVSGKKNKIENCRIYFKPDQKFLAELTKKLPDKIMENDERAVLADLNRV